MDLGEVVSSATGGGLTTGSPWGAVGAGVLNYMGTQSTNEANADIAASNNQWSASQYANRYQTMVKDIQSAGLNPMLAYSQSPGSAPSAQQVQFQNPMSSAVQGFTDVLGTRAKASSDVASANKAYSEQERIDQETESIKRTLKAGGPENEQERVKALTASFVASTNLMIAQKATEPAKKAHLEQLVVNLKSDNVITAAEAKAIQDSGGIGRLARELKPISDIGSDWIGLKGMFARDKANSADRAADRVSRERGRSSSETGTYYDKHGNETGGYSRQRSER